MSESTTTTRYARHTSYTDKHTNTPCACLDAFSFSADRVVWVSFLIGTAVARTLYTLCGAMMMMMQECSSNLLRSDS